MADTTAMRGLLVEQTVPEPSHRERASVWALVSLGATASAAVLAVPAAMLAILLPVAAGLGALAYAGVGRLRTGRRPAAVLAVYSVLVGVAIQSIAGWDRPILAAALPVVAVAVLTVVFRWRGARVPFRAGEGPLAVLAAAVVAVALPLAGYAWLLLVAGVIVFRPFGFIPGKHSLLPYMAGAIPVALALAALAAPGHGILFP